MDPFQPRHGDSMVACNHCRPSLGGRHLCLQLQVVNGHEPLLLHRRFAGVLVSSSQVWCQNADSIGGSLSGLLAMWLFSLDPAAPFAVGAVMACIVWSIYTVEFYWRLGFGDDIETAEDKWFSP